MTPAKWNIDAVRAQFPALSLSVNGQPAAFFDGPGGTQVPNRVLEAVSTYLTRQNANRHGQFHTSAETDRIIDKSRHQLATLLNAHRDEIAFGANMTTLNFALAHALARDLEAGDEVIVTDLDHEANRAPWFMLKEKGVIVRRVPVDLATCTLDMTAFSNQLSDRTRIIAVTAASNAVGTIPDLSEIRQRTPKAILVVDGVHYAPHEVSDMRKWDCDFFLCSAYKFFGPHIGILYGKRNAFEALQTDRVRAQQPTIPHRIETGTLNHEGIAGAGAAVSFMMDPEGEHLDRPPEGGRERLVGQIRRMKAYEHGLMKDLLDGLDAISGLKPLGAPDTENRTPTVSFTMEGCPAPQVARQLAERGIFVWDGDFYATTLIEQLGLSESGVVRVGLAPYNTQDEVMRLLDALERCQ